MKLALLVVAVGVLVGCGDDTPTVDECNAQVLAQVGDGGTVPVDRRCIDVYEHQGIAVPDITVSD